MKNRMEYFDLFRAFGIVCMVMGHIGCSSTADHFIHAFHMPVFFLISGFFFKHEDGEMPALADFIVKKAKKLLWPYLFWGMAAYVLWIIRYGIDISPLKSIFFINTENFPIAGALWFLTALYFAEILFYMINQYIKGRVLMIFACLLITFIGIKMGGVQLFCHLQSVREWSV